MRVAPSITRSQFPIARGSVAQTRVEFATDFRDRLPRQTSATDFIESIAPFTRLCSGAKCRADFV